VDNVKKEVLNGVFIVLDRGVDGVCCLTVCPGCLRNVLTKEDAIKVVRMFPNWRRIDKFFGGRGLKWNISFLRVTRLTMRGRKIKEYYWPVISPFCSSCCRFLVNTGNLPDKERRKELLWKIKVDVNRNISWLIDNLPWKIYGLMDDGTLKPATQVKEIRGGKVW